MFTLISGSLVKSVYGSNTRELKNQRAENENDKKSKESHNSHNGEGDSIYAVLSEDRIYYKNLSNIRNINNAADAATADEKSRKKYEKKIMAKLGSGKPLTTKEKNFLRKYNPDMYLHVCRIEAKRKALETSLKHCKSKEEAQQAMDTSMGSISEKDPVRKYMVSAVEYTMKEFKETSSYRKLPATTEEAMEKSKRNQRGINRIKNAGSEEEENENDGFGGENLNVQYNTPFGGYQEAFVDSAADCFISEG